MMKYYLIMNISTLITWIPVIAAIIAATVAILSLPIANWLANKREHKQWLRNERLSTSVNILKSVDGLIESTENYLKLYLKRRKVLDEIQQLKNNIKELEIDPKKLEKDMKSKTNETDLNNLKYTIKKVDAKEDKIYEDLNEEIETSKRYEELFNTERDKFALLSSYNARYLMNEMPTLIIQASEVGSHNTKYAEAEENLAELIPKLKKAKGKLIEVFRSDIGI